ncbi:AT-hook motif nuclear-localized protein 29-like [Vigna radiata var. radiata]|uniref:AT-hook motif nuclear-localized protein 29-like n=1 Tax=Vigna radiata var. radiata TaxID=3916 RepID=A0A1S3UJE7_VIGRR|nr:AT-hook motif nuclear-localized protein 29-like [Vigna radiata var. radiata]
MVDFPLQNILFRNSDSESSMVRLIIVKVASGCDIIESILDVGRKNHTSLTIQSASGTIASVTLGDNPDVRFYGPFNIVSLTGSYLYHNQDTPLLELIPPPSFSFGLILSTRHGSAFGGNVGGRLIAHNDVNLTIFTFNNES